MFSHAWRGSQVSVRDGGNPRSFGVVLLDPGILKFFRIPLAQNRQSGHHLLAAAVLVVIYAGQLTSYDVSAISETDRLKSELRSASNTLAQLGHYQELLSQPPIDKAVDPKGAELRANDYLDASRSLFSSGLLVPKDVPAAVAMVAVQQKWIEALDTLYKESWDE